MMNTDTSAPKTSSRFHPNVILADGFLRAIHMATTLQGSGSLPGVTSTVVAGAAHLAGQASSPSKVRKRESVATRCASRRELGLTR